MGRVFDERDLIPQARDHSMGVVRQLRPVVVNPRHPSLFDQDEAAADRAVLLTGAEAKLIAAVLRHARGHVPSPKALDEAIDLLSLASVVRPGQAERGSR
jgi:hypothetical protein